MANSRNALRNHFRWMYFAWVFVLAAALSTESGRGATFERGDASVGLDVHEPAPDVEVEWTHEASNRRTLDDLAYVVINHASEPVRLNVSLTWDSGTTEATTNELPGFTVAPGAREVHALPRALVPPEAVGGNFPGLLHLSLQSPTGVHILEPFYVTPRHRSGPEVMTAEDLQEEIARLPRDDEERGTGLRIVEWIPEVNPNAGGVASALLEGRGPAAATSFRTCVLWQAQTIDSGFGEDRLSWANNPNKVVTAYGVRIRITASDDSWSAYYNTSPSTGCVDWSGNQAASYDVRVYYYVKDANDNLIRYHDGGDGVFGSYPGNTYWYQVNNYVPTPGATTKVKAGNWSPRATAMSTASMMSRYFAGLTQSKQIHVADAVSCGGSSAHHCTSNCNYSSDAYVRLQLDSCPDSSDHRRRKFITAHELGHARAILQQGGLEPNVNTALGVGGCNDGSSYSMTSREWNSVSMREGFAHFAAVWTYNDASQSDASIRWFNTTFDVESNSPNLSGGYVENNCGGSVDGQGTNLDAMRMLWDWATPSSASGHATRANVMNTYEGMVDAAPADFQYFVRFYLDASANLSVAKRNRLWTSACWNGLIPQNLC